MKIHLYLKHFPPSGTEFKEGTGKAVHGFASGLAACGADVIVICEGARRDDLLESQAGYKIMSFSSNNTSPSLKLSESLKRYVLSLSKENLFILNGIFHRSVYALARVLRDNSLPYIIAPHDPYHPTIFHKNSYLKWPYWYFLEKPMLRQANAIQVLDRRHAEWLKKLKVKTPILEVINGFSPTDICQGSTLNWSLNKIPRFLFLGRLDSYNKGLDILLEAFAQLREVPEWELTFQGPDWGDRLKLELQARKLGISHQVTFLDPDYNSSPSSIIAKHDVFCIASRFEGFSLSALEAMLAGRVLLVSEIAGIAPYITASNCGVIVQPTPDSVRAGLVNIIHQRLQWREMGLRGQKYALKHLQWDTIASRALSQYRGLVSFKS